MYRFVERLTPDDLEAIAAFAYMEMLEAGFTWVAEFHYLHHQPDGRPYDNVGRDVGAHRGGGRCGGHRPHAAAGALSPERLPRQAADAGAAPLPERSRPLCAADGDPGARRQHRHRAPFAARRHARRSAVGRRAPGAACRRTSMSRTDARGRGVPGRARQAADRPAARHACEVDARRWCLVHATHADAGELARIAKAKAVVGLCPITEANLGDGLFDAPAFLAQGGRFGIGSDSLSASPPPTSCAPWNTASA